MEKQIKILENGNVQIGKVVLTDRALNILDDLQDEDNSYLNKKLEDISESVFFLLENAENYNEAHRFPSYNTAARISFLHNILKDLAKPLE